MIYGGNGVELMSKVQIPLLLLPAGNDPDTYRPGGAFFEALSAAAPGSETAATEFAAMTHGWVTRGDLSKPEVREAVELAYTKIFAFISRFAN